MNPGLYPNNVNAVRSYTSPLVSNIAPAGLRASLTHGFTTTPRRVRWVLVCVVAELNYAVGDEVDVSGVDNAGNLQYTGGANATSVFIVSRGTGLRIADKSSGSFTSLTAASWRLKCYADL